MIGQLLALSRHAFLESLRRQVFLVLLLLVTALLVLNPAISRYTFDDDNKLLLDLGLSTILLGGIVLASLTASGVLRQEYDAGTILTLLSKPISRPLLILGKYCGIAAAIGLCLGTWTIVFLMTLRHGVMQTARHTVDAPVLTFGIGAGVLALLIALAANYFFRQHFGAVLSRALFISLTLAYVLTLFVARDGSLQSPGTDLDAKTLWALLLVAEATCFFAAVALAVAAYWSQISALFVCLLLFFVGLCSDYAFGRFADSSTAARVVHKMIPNMQFLWLTDAVTQNRPIDAYYVLLTSAYCLLLTGAALCAAIVFLREEVR